MTAKKLGNIAFGVAVIAYLIMMVCMVARNYEPQPVKEPITLDTPTNKVITRTPLGGYKFNMQAYERNMASAVSGLPCKTIGGKTVCEAPDYESDDGIYFVPTPDFGYTLDGTTVFDLLSDFIVPSSTSFDGFIYSPSYHECLPEGEMVRCTYIGDGNEN